MMNVDQIYLMVGHAQKVMLQILTVTVVVVVWIQHVLMVQHQVGQTVMMATHVDMEKLIVLQILLDVQMMNLIV